MAGVNGVSITGPTKPVLVNSSGQLGTATASSARLKTDIRSLDSIAIERVLALDPVSYRYKTGSGQRQYGLLAEQVAKLFPALAQYDEHGKASGVYYQELSVLLLAQARRQHRRLQRQSARRSRTCSASLTCCAGRCSSSADAATGAWRRRRKAAPRDGVAPPAAARGVQARQAPPGRHPPGPHAAVDCLKVPR